MMSTLVSQKQAQVHKSNGERGTGVLDEERMKGAKRREGLGAGFKKEERRRDEKRVESMKQRGKE